jgi:hypothetical protein
MLTSAVSGVDAVRRRSVLTRRARVGSTRVRPLHPHAVHRAAEAGTTHIERARSNCKLAWAQVRACVRACVPRTACARGPARCRCAAPASAYARGVCMRVSVCVREVGACANVSVCVCVCVYSRVSPLPRRPQRRVPHAIDFRACAAERLG